MENFEDILLRLKSINNEERAEAETAYEQITASQRFSLLVEKIADANTNLELRVFCGVLCRRLLDSEYTAAFNSLGDETKTLIKHQLIQLLIGDSPNSVRKKLAEIVAEIAKNHFDEEDNFLWPDFITFIFQTCLQQQEKPSLRVTGLQLFTSVPGLFGTQTAQNASNLTQVLATCLSPNAGLVPTTISIDPQEVIAVRQQAVKALSSFVMHLVQEEEDDGDEENQPGIINGSQSGRVTEICFRQMKDLIPLVLQTILDHIEVDPCDDTLMKCLVDMTDSAPAFIQYHLESVLQLCIKILTTGSNQPGAKPAEDEEELDETQKHLAIEVIVTLTEQCTTEVRRHFKMLSPFFQALFRMLTDLDDVDDQQWAMRDEEVTDDEQSSCATAEMALDRLACALRGNRMLTEIIHTVPLMLHSAHWPERYGGLMALSACAEGLQKVMEPMLSQIIDEVLPLMTDSEPRVRYAACNALGQLSTDFEPRLQKVHHARVLPALLARLDDTDNPRVQAHAGAALVNFSEGAPKQIMIQYVDMLANKLNQVMNQQVQILSEYGRKLVLEQTVTAVAAVADSVADKFAPYYDNFMPTLKLLMNMLASRTEFRLLRGKTIECISLMGLAVGKEKFTKDAQDIMQMLMNAQKEIMGNAVSASEKDAARVPGTNQGDGVDESSTVMASDDPQQSYMISAWARICKLLGKDFEPFLPFVMPHVMQAASIKPDVCVLYNDDVQEVDKEDAWQVVKVGEDQNFAINTTGLDDKATACQMLVCYAKELGQAFAPYVLQVAELMLPLLQFYFNDEVRSAAADIMPCLLECSQPLGADTTKQLWDRILPALQDAMENEHERSQLADMFEALAECILVMGPGCLPVEAVNTAIKQMNQQFTDMFKRHGRRSALRSAADYDDEEEEKLQNLKEEDDVILSHLVNVMHSLFVVEHERALPFYEMIMQNVIKLMEPGRTWSDLQYALCFWDDVIEFCGPVSFNYQQIFLETMVRSISHEQTEVRQAAAYGLGLCAMFGGPNYSPVLRQAAPDLLRMIQMENSRDEELNVSTENAISALTKMSRYQPDSLPTDSLQSFLATWLAWLPVWEDCDEVPHVLDYLCELVEASNPAILGNDNANLPLIMRAIAVPLQHESLSARERPDNKQAQYSDKSRPCVQPEAVYQRCLNIVRTIQGNPSVFEACLARLSDVERMALQVALQ